MFFGNAYKLRSWFEELVHAHTAIKPAHADVNNKYPVESRSAEPYPQPYEYASALSSTL